MRRRTKRAPEARASRDAGVFSPQKILKIGGLRIHFEGSMIEGKSELKNVDITVKLQIGFFLAQRLLYVRILQF